MLVVGGNRLITLVPIDAVADDIETLACIIGKGDFFGIGVQEMCHTFTGVVEDSKHTLKACCTESPVLPLLLYPLLHSAGNTGGQRAERSGIHIDTRSCGGHFLVNVL